jgi:predicted small integral membrane protein
MGTFLKGALEGFKVKVGSVTGTEWKGLRIMRRKAAPGSKGSLSQSQPELQAGFSFAKNFLLPPDKLLNQTFDRYTKDGHHALQQQSTAINCLSSFIMYSAAFLFRVAKAISVFAVGFMSLLIVIGNVTDYYTNYHFVEHVVKMDTIFPDSHVHYRSINNPALFHAVYFFIIVMESMMTFFCLKGSWLLFWNLKSEPAVFHASKNWAVAGLIIGIVIWFFGFEVVGGEWFSMWQSTAWNGLGSAERIVSFVVLTLILLQCKDEAIPK